RHLFEQESSLVLRCPQKGGELALSEQDRAAELHEAQANSGFNLFERLGVGALADIFARLEVDEAHARLLECAVGAFACPVHAPGRLPPVPLRAREIDLCERFAGAAPHNRAWVNRANT